MKFRFISISFVLIILLLLLSSYLGAQTECNCQNISSLIEELASNDMMREVECEDHTYYAPNHWYLPETKICSGDYVFIFEQSPGLDNYDNRKDRWRKLFYSMALMYTSENARQYGKSPEEIVEQLSLGLKLISLSVNIAKIDGVTKVNPGKTTLIFRKSIAELPRDFLVKIGTYGGRQATYANTLVRMQRAADASKLASKTTEIYLDDEGFEAIYLQAQIEAVLEIWAYYLLELNWVQQDQALVDVLNEFTDLEYSELTKMFKEIEDRDLADQVIGLTEISGIIAKILSTSAHLQAVSPYLAGFAKVAGFVGVLYWGGTEVYDAFFVYYEPLEVATLGYTLASNLLDRCKEDDCVLKQMSCLAIYSADKNMDTYFDVSLFNAMINTQNILIDDIGDVWHSVIHEGDRSDRIEAIFSDCLECRDDEIIEELVDDFVIFVVDVSGSMGKNNKLNEVKETIPELVKDLQSNTKSYALIVYSSKYGCTVERTPIIVPFTNEYDDIIGRSSGLTAGGNTPMLAGIEKAYQYARYHMNPGAKGTIILLCDGQQNCPSGNIPALNDITVKYFALSGPTSPNITLTSIGYGNLNHNEKEALDDLAKQGSGFFVESRDASTIKSAFRRAMLKSGFLEEKMISGAALMALLLILLIFAII